MAEVNVAEIVLPEGSRFTILEVERRSIRSGKQRTILFALCRCQCGTEKWTRLCGVKNGHALSCGCLHREKSGRTFFASPIVVFPGSRLTPIREERKDGKLWAWCRCECGVEKWIARASVQSGKAMSCGCYRRERIAAGKTPHELVVKKAHGVWNSMKQRCCNPNQKAYKNYGARGIRVCDEWQDFRAFYSHLLTLLPVGETDIPKGLTIDRKDNNLGYEPGNIRLVSYTVQARNKRGNRLITLDGVTRCLAEWAEITGISADIVSQRLCKGWDERDALTRPPRKSPKRLRVE